MIDNNNNVVIYARYSSTGQNEQTIEGQIRVCKEFAEQKGYNVVKTYMDKAKTGTNDNRPDFQRMVKDAAAGTANGAFKYIIVYMFDRFARNRRDSIMYKELLRDKYGVKVLSALEPVSDDEGGEFYEMFLEWNAEKYSKRLSKRIRDGLTTAMANGTFTGQKLIYGYKLIDTDKLGKKGTIKRVLIDDRQAEAIRYIFEQYAQGMTHKRIAESLNEQGYRLANGDLFQGRTFEKWLVNEKYTGVFTYGGRVCNNVFPAIINRELFDKVQERLIMNRHFTKANVVREPYLLTSKLFCGECGTLMRADGGVSGTGAIHKYYVCSKARKKLCDKCREKKDELETFVTAETVNYFSDPKRVNKVAGDVVAYFDRLSDENNLKSIDAQIAHTKKEMKDTTTAFVQAVSLQNEFLQNSCQERITELGNLIADLQKQRTKLELERGQKITHKDIVSFINEFIEGDVKDKAFQKRLIDNLVYLVYAYDGKTAVFFTVKASTKDLPPISNVEATNAIKAVQALNNGIENDTKIAEHNSSATNESGGEKANKSEPLNYGKIY